MAAPANGPLAAAAIGVEARLAGVEAGLAQLQAQMQAQMAQMQAQMAQMQAQMAQMQAQMQAGFQGIAAQMAVLGGGDEHQRRARAPRERGLVGRALRRRTGAGRRRASFLAARF